MGILHEGDLGGHCYSTDTKITTRGLLEKHCALLETHRLCLRATELCWKGGMELEGWIPGATLPVGKERRDPCLCCNAAVDPGDFVVDLVVLGVFLTLQI